MWTAAQMSDQTTDIIDIEQFLGVYSQTASCKTESADTMTSQQQNNLRYYDRSMQIPEYGPLPPLSYFSSSIEHASLCHKYDAKQFSFDFQLGASTSPAIKKQEESLTCLNQGQSYELKLKQVYPNSEWSPILLFKSIVRVMFHDRRLQYSEQEHFQQWRQNRPENRLIEIDIPLSYNFMELRNDPEVLNAIEVGWSNQVEATISIKLNCISTEFTSRKHGGEKGVPFRLQVETFAVSTFQELELVNCAYCLVKIFKPNGADRKNKNDIKKISKLPSEEQEMYQPSCPVTHFIEVSKSHAVSYYERFSDRTPSVLKESSNVVLTSIDETKPEPALQTQQISPKQHMQQQQPPQQQILLPHQQLQHHQQLQQTCSPVPKNTCQPGKRKFHLTPNSSSLDVQKWMTLNNFGDYLELFKNYSGADMFLLNRNDFVMICGTADGIRMNNAIHARQIRPKLTIYVRELSNKERDTIFRQSSINKRSLSYGSLETMSPTSSMVSSTVTSGSCSNLLTTNVGCISMDGQQQQQQQPACSSTMLDLPGCERMEMPRRRQHSDDTAGGGGRDEEEFASSASKRPRVVEAETTIKNEPVYQPIFLEYLSFQNLNEKLSEVYALTSRHDSNIHLYDQKGFKINVTDDLIQNIEDQSRFALELTPDEHCQDLFHFILHATK